jgi:hypothetical protein
MKRIFACFRRLTPEVYLTQRAQLSSGKIADVLRDMRAVSSEEACLALSMHNIDPSRAAARVISSFVKLKRAQIKS